MSSAEQPARTGVTVDNTNDTRGLIFYTSHGEFHASLIDRSGKVVHKWSASYSDVFGDSLPRLPIYQLNYTWTEAHPFPNGDILVIFRRKGMAKLDKDSRVLWKSLNHAHHDLEVADDGDIFVMTKKTMTCEGFTGCESLKIVDHLSVLSPSGEERRSYSLYEAIERSKFRGLLSTVDYTSPDLLHTNDFTFIPEDHWLQRERDAEILFSVRFLAGLFALDTDSGQVTWGMVGRTAEQHDPRFLDDGRILVFDNGTVQRQSRLVAIDPRKKTLETLWTSEDFFTKCCGYVQILEDGNYLITETTQGRSLQINRQGDIVWEFINPRTTRSSDTTIARMNQAERYPKDYFTFLRD